MSDPRTARTIKLTKRTVDALEPREKPYVTFDSDLTGFGVRTMPTGTKSFCVEYRPGAGGRGVYVKRVSLGRYGPVTVDLARRLAADTLAKVKLGSDPAQERAPSAI
jgi:Arm DNA-binding domain